MPTDSPTPVLLMQDLSLSAPAATPRPLSPEAKRAILAEPRVRRWWLLLFVIVLLFASYTFDRLWERQDEIKLIRDGMKVTAKLADAAPHSVGQATNPSDAVDLLLKLPTGEETVGGLLSKSAIVGSDVTVHVDPKNHTHWTDRDEPTPLIESLLIGLVLSPLMPLMFFVTWSQLKKTQKLWQSGTAQVAVVFDRKPSAIAPMSYSVRCTLLNQKNKEIFNVYVPRIGYGLKKGDRIWVITPSRKGPSLAGLWMNCGSVQA